MDGTTSETVDALGRFLDRVASYYNLSPEIWWTVVGLVALTIVAWGYRGRRKG